MRSREERNDKLLEARTQHKEMYDAMLLNSLRGVAGNGKTTNRNIVRNAFDIADEAIMEYAERFPELLPGDAQ